MAGISDTLSSIPQPVQWLFGGIGALYISSKVLSYIHLLLNIFVLSGTNLRKYGGKGTWVLITGASDGLGKEFATQIAAKGFNLVLVSRTLSKLEALAKELEQKHASSGLQTKVLAMDFSKNNDADYERLAQLIDGLDIGILINNVGQSHDIAVPFLETEKEELQNIVMINCLSTLRTTNVVLPGMVQRKRGLILTMGSFGGWMPIPYLATYSGSKAFLQHWSSALAGEVKSSNIDVTLCLSYNVTGAMSKIRRPNALVPPPRPFIKAALSKVGLSSTNYVAYNYTPWWSHALMQWWVENTIGLGSRLGIWYNLRIHKDIRVRALRKKAREAARKKDL